MKRNGLLMIFASALAACAGAAAPLATPPTTPPLPTQAGRTPTVAPDPLPVSPDIFIVFQRAGGLLGASDKWTVYPSGRIVGGDGAVWQVPPDQIAPLFALVETPDFQALHAKYIPAGACNDCFTYTLTVHGQGDPQTIVFMDGAAWPPPLRQASSVLQEAVAR